MTRLSIYLIRLFATEAAALYAVVLGMLFLVQTLRIADVASVRGSGLGALLTQTVLGLPSLSLIFLYICIAIGLARALRNLQASRELHIIHVGQRLPVLLRAITGYAVSGAVLVLLLTHVIEPAANREANLIRAGIAADLVSRSLVPNRFAEVSPGVTITIGGRLANGEISMFYADDKRQPETRRTYIAESAVISADELGYVLQLNNGTVQYLSASGQFSEIAFTRYDIPVERLTGEFNEERGDQSTIALVSRALESGNWPPELSRRLAERMVDGFRVLALCLFVAGVAAFPSGRRRPMAFPIEAVVFLAIFFERAVPTFVPRADPIGLASGCFALLLISLSILFVRLRIFVPQPREVHSA